MIKIRKRLMICEVCGESIANTSWRGYVCGGCLPIFDNIEERFLIIPMLLGETNKMNIKLDNCEIEFSFKRGD